MPRWFLLLAFPVVLGFVCVTATMAARELDPATQLQRAEAARHEAAMNAIAEAEAQERARVLAPALALAGAVLALGASGVLVVLGAVYAYHRLQFIDVQGVSVSRQLALAGATYPAMLSVVTANGQAAVEAARNPAPMLPPGLRSYSPRYANREIAAPRQASPVTASPALPPPPSQPVPTLAQVLRARPANEVIVGYKRNGDAVSLGLDSIGATLVVGQRRTGKSTTVAFLMTQLAAINSQFFVIDPHAPLEDSLAQRLAPLGSRLAMCVATPEEAIGVLRAVTSELERRRAGEQSDPLFLCVDELNTMMMGEWAAVGEQVSALAKRLALEGGKMGMGVISAAHLVDMSNVGSHFAYTASTVLAHRSVPSAVSRFVGDMAQHVGNLGRGEIIAVYPGDRAMLRVPRAEPGDIMQAVATLPAPGGCPPLVAQPTTSATTAEAVVDEATARHNRIHALANAGYSRNEISRVVFGHKDDGTMNEIRAVLGPVE